VSRYLAVRLLAAIPTLIIVSVGIFTLVRLIPGSTIDLALAGNPNIEDRAAFERQLGLDKPAIQQYFIWMGDLLRGDLGNSLTTRRSIGDDLRERFPRTIQLGLMAMVLGIVLSLAMGVIAAVKAGGVLDNAIRTMGVLFISIPYFFVALLVVAFPARYWGWSPPLVFTPFMQNPWENVKHFFLPALILGVFTAGGVQLRLTRAMMLEVLRQDYMRTARAKGLAQRAIVLRHGLRNALIPLVTLYGLQIPIALGGTVIMESIFNIPGVGSYVTGAVANRDYVALQSTVIVFAVIVFLVNFLVDMLYARLDPRVSVN
jgi:peptide/nickel transport system permease protein